jgi:hypothetical protein
MEIAMKLTAQIGRGLVALTFGVAIAAYAVAGPADENSDQSYPNVAHTRVDIVTLPSAPSNPHWAVASVRVGDPIVKTAERRVAQHAHLDGVSG